MIYSLEIDAALMMLNMQSCKQIQYKKVHKVAYLMRQDE